jgi:hypothetical protein
MFHYPYNASKFNGVEGDVSIMLVAWPLTFQNKVGSFLDLIELPRIPIYLGCGE